MYLGKAEDTSAGWLMRENKVFLCLILLQIYCTDIKVVFECYKKYGRQRE